MSKNIQCYQCQKNFPEQEVYRIGIKQKHFYCQECAKNIKSECMWCGKKLAEKRWQGRGAWSGLGLESRKEKLNETIDRDNHRGEKHHVYYLICPEELYGKDWIKCCRGKYNRWFVDSKNQKYQDHKNQGWKECAGKGVYHRDPETGKVIFDLDCCKLVPPGKKYCGDDQCVYYTAVYKNEHSEARKKIADKWNKRDQEKYAKANEWWNSLSLTEKQAKLKDEETKLKNLGLQRQRCWIERLDKNSILFENGKLYYDNMNKIPPSFLHDWGYPGYQWENIWKNDGNHSNTALHKVEIDKEIKQKENELKQAKEKKDNELVVNLEKQLQELRKQKKDNSISQISLKKAVIYSFIGVSFLVLVGFTVWLIKSKPKKPKIN